MKEGPGREKVEANCAACHSLDYIVANSPFLTRQVWDAEVTKMIKAFGAPISDADAKEIVDYLNANYGSARNLSARPRAFASMSAGAARLARFRDEQAQPTLVVAAPARVVAGPPSAARAATRRCSGCVTPMMRCRPRSSKP